MDASVTLRLIVYFALLLLSGFFSGSETALFSLGRVQIMRLEQQGHPRASLLRALLDHPRRLIATIFIGNEFVNIGASALMATVTHRYLDGGSQATVALVSTGVSVGLILLLGEITPKNIAARIVERWSLAAARPIWLLAHLMAPLRWVIERIADVVVRMVGGGRPRAQGGSVGEDEFRLMVDTLEREGEIDQREGRLIHSVFDIGDRRVTEVMTPAGHVFALSYNLSLKRVVDEVRGSHYSRIPVYRGRRDNIEGILYAKDLIPIAHGVQPAPPRLASLLRPPYFVPASTKCDQLLREFRRRRMHLALVVDEYGHLAGLVTMEDLLEEMFGEIVDEKELPRPAEVRAGGAGEAGDAAAATDADAGGAGEAGDAAAATDADAGAASEARS